MSDILDEIVRAKAKRLDAQKKSVPLQQIEKDALSRPYSSSLAKAICVQGELSVIAEMKRQSPSAGNLTGPGPYDPAALARDYEAAGARGLSVLTEEDYFKGAASDVAAAQTSSKVPILRKDFIIDPYQVFETKVIGASAVLLIIACLTPSLYAELYGLAKNIKLDVLVEVHSERELDAALKASPALVGINNRNLKTLQTDLKTTFELFDKVPKSAAVVSESGIREPETIRELRSLGVRAALIGESILKSGDRSAMLRELVRAGRG